MKFISYEKRMNKTIVEVKMYLLLLMEEKYQREIHDIINSSIDITQLQKKIRKRIDISLAIFIQIKKVSDAVDDFSVLEEHLAYMNVLLDPLFQPVISYKYNLFQYLVNHQDFTLQTYCIMRHLIKFEEDRVDLFIAYMCEKTNKTKEDYHYLACEILCMEHIYTDAYKHLPDIVFDAHLEKYKMALYQYSPYKYRKAMGLKRGFLQILDSR